MRKKLLVIKKIFIIVLSVFMIIIGAPQVNANSDYMEIVVNDSEVGFMKEVFLIYLKAGMSIGQLKQFLVKVILRFL